MSNMLGTLTKPFDISDMRQLLQKANTLDELKMVKDYILGYFGHCIASIGIVMWVPIKKTFRILTDTEARKFIRKEVKLMNIPGMKGTVKFDLQSWFFHEHGTLYDIGCDPTKPIVYKEKDQSYINLFPGYLHENVHKFSEYSQETCNAVKIILEHIENIWCSSNQDQYEYVLKWLAHMISGRKMNTCLLLRSKQGTGKSIITEFIEEKVLGEQAVCTSSDPNTILGTFNKELLGKSLLVLEEMPASTQGEWKAASERLKHLITGKSLLIHEKNKTPFSIRNSISLLILTNNNAIRLSSEDRRYFIPDISTKHIGNHDYFDKLGNAIDYPDVGEAFYTYMKEIAAAYPQFAEKKIPKSVAKQEQIVESLHSIHVFIKEYYLKASRGIDEPFSNFYNTYSGRRDKPSSKIAISKLLATDLNLKTFQKRVGKYIYIWLNISFENLYTIFQSKGWIHEVDEIEPPTDNKDSVNLENEVDEIEPSTDNKDFANLENVALEIEPSTDDKDSVIPVLDPIEIKEPINVKSQAFNNYLEQLLGYSKPNSKEESKVSNCLDFSASPNIEEDEDIFDSDFLANVDQTITN